MVLWNYLATHSYEDQSTLALECEKTAHYALERLQTVKEIHPDFFVERTPLALTVRFRKPNDEIIFRYSLSCESLNMETTDDEGRQATAERHYAHLFAMMSTTPETIDALVADLRQDDAFREVVTATLREPGRGWR